MPNPEIKSDTENIETTGYITFGLGLQRWRRLHNIFYVGLTIGGTGLGAYTAYRYLQEGNIKMSTVMGVSSALMIVLGRWYVSETYSDPQP